MAPSTADATDERLAHRLRELEQEISQVRRELRELRHPIYVPPGDFSALACTVGEQPCAIVSHHVEQVVPLMWLDPLPESEPWVAGTFDLCGERVAVIDVLARWNLRDGPRTLQDRVVIVLVDGRRVGLLVSAVDIARTYERDQLRPIPADLPAAPYVVGVLGDHAYLLDPKTLAETRNG